MPDLRAHLEVEFRNGLLIQGTHPRELAQRFRKHYGGSVKDTERLMVTEMRRLQTSVQKESFERNGYKDYQFISAGDERVCPECAKLHGQHFKVSEMRIGENAPPMHPSCHCSVAAWSDKEKYNRWIDALANGEDVRWDEFEAKKIFPLSSNPSTNDVDRSASELEAVAREIKKDMKKYIEKPSIWSGTVKTVSDISKMPIKNATGYKDWNCDIVVLSNVTDYIMWHEMIHSSSVSYYDETVYLENQIIEEYSVELLTREICKEKGIEASNYDDKRMECLLIVSEYLGYKSRLEFAKDLFNHDLPDRYNWLETQFCDKMLSDGLDVIEMQEGIDYIRKLQGGLENGHKNSPIT